MVYTILLQHLLESLSTSENFLLTAGMEHSSVSEYEMNINSFSKALPDVFAKSSLHVVHYTMCVSSQLSPLGTDQVSSASSVTNASCIKVDTSQAPALNMSFLGV